MLTYFSYLFDIGAMPRGKRRPGTTSNGGKSPAAKQRKGNTKNTGNVTRGQADPQGATIPPNSATGMAPASPGEHRVTDTTPTNNQTGIYQDVIQGTAPIIKRS